MLYNFTASTNPDVLRAVLEYLLPGKNRCRRAGIFIVQTTNFLLKKNETTVIRRCIKIKFAIGTLIYFQFCFM